MTEIDDMLIQRVAVALAKEYNDSQPFHYWERMAKAAIAAMRDGEEDK